MRQNIYETAIYMTTIDDLESELDERLETERPLCIGDFAPWFLTRLHVDEGALTAVGIAWDTEIAYLEARREEPLYVDLDDSVGGSMVAQITKLETDELAAASSGVPTQFSLEMSRLSVDERLEAEAETDDMNLNTDDIATNDALRSMSNKCNTQEDTDGGGDAPHEITIQTGESEVRR